MVCPRLLVYGKGSTNVDVSVPGTFCNNIHWHSILYPLQLVSLECSRFPTTSRSVQLEQNSMVTSGYTPLNTCMYTCLNSHAHRHTHTHTHMYTCLNPHTCRHTHTHMYRCLNPHTCRHTYTQSETTHMQYF